MIEVRCNIIGDKAHWSVGRGVVDGTVEDVVRLVFSITGFASFSQRDAYELIRSALRRETITWVQPSLDAWRFELGGLSSVIGRPEIVPWLQGSVSIKPEFKYRTIPIDVPPVSSGAFVFYISADTTSEVAKMERIETPSRDEGFICYSHADEKWLNRVRVHLRPLERRRVFKLFDDSQIKPGTRWKDEINAALDRARVAILLVSADFLASDFIAENELPPLLKKAESGGAIILPVIVSPCGFFKEKTLADYQAVNDPSKPLDGLTPSESEHVLTRLADALEVGLTGASESDSTMAGISRQRPSEEVQKKSPTSEGAKEILQLIQAGADPENRGLTEILDSPKPGYTFFLSGLRDAGSPYKLKSRVFREGVEELVAGGWLYPPEDTGKTRLYEFRVTETRNQ